jgi:hypothetical protein
VAREVERGVARSVGKRREKGRGKGRGNMRVKGRGNRRVKGCGNMRVKGCGNRRGTGRGVKWSVVNRRWEEAGRRGELRRRHRPVSYRHSGFTKGAVVCHVAYTWRAAAELRLRWEEGIIL